VQTLNRVLALHMAADGRVSVDMGAPDFELSALPFDASGLQARLTLGWSTWPLEVSAHGQQTVLHTAVLSMGNPHAVQLVDNVDSAPVSEWGPQIESHTRFARHVNAGFMQLLSRTEMRLRVYERGAGETLACGTGACAAVVAGIRLGLLDSRVDVHTRGGLLTVDWPASAGQMDAAVTLSGPATRVFEGEIEIPDA
jgi:diaminopimelate epimerase